MTKKLQLTSLSFLMLVGVLFSSCGNIEIVKRKYRPGFHVDITKKKQKPTANKEKVKNEKRNQILNTEEKATTHYSPKAKNLNLNRPKPVVDKTTLASLNTAPDVKKIKRKENVRNTMNNLLAAPFRELKREKMGREMRRAIFNAPDDEKSLSIPGILSTIFAALSLISLIAVTVSLVLSSAAGFLFVAWWLLALFGTLFGAAAMILGIIGIKQTKNGEKRGKGFAIAGMIGGIVFMAISMLILFWGAVLSVLAS